MNKSNNYLGSSFLLVGLLTFFFGKWYVGLPFILLGLAYLLR